MSASVARWVPKFLNLVWDSLLQQIAVGFASACALLNSGKVYCLGFNDWGKLGMDPSPNQCPDGHCA